MSEQITIEVNTTRLREAAHACGIKNANQLWAVLGGSKETARAWWDGTVTMFAGRTLAKLSFELGVSWTELLQERKA